jgi:tight adherence protein C
MVISLLAALAVFVAVMLLAMWIVSPARSPLDARTRALTLGRRPANLAEAPFRHRVLLPVVNGFTRGVMEMLPQAFVVRTDKRLTEAGKPISVQTFFALVLAVGTLMPVTLFLMLWSATDGSPPRTTLLLVPTAALFGAALPFVWLSRRARVRKLEVWKSLPGAFDLITTCVEAGLSLDAAFQRVAEKLRGPFTDEVRHMLLEVQMGRPRREALEDLADRTQVPELLTFVNAVIQAQQLGTNLGRVLRAQADQMRVKRRQRAEETARRMPTKMVFPLVFFMMPALFIVIIGPVAISVIEALSDS